MNDFLVDRAGRPGGDGVELVVRVMRRMTGTKRSDERLMHLAGTLRQRILDTFHVICADF